MLLIPYLHREYITHLTTDEIRSKVSDLVEKPDWNFTFQKGILKNIFEGEINNNSFIIVKQKYGITYGRRSLLPYLKGEIKQGIKGQSILNITIKASKGSWIYILMLIYILAGIAIYISWTNNNIEGIIVPAILIAISYASVMYRFNKDKEYLINFIEKELL